MYIYIFHNHFFTSLDNDVSYIETSCNVLLDIFLLNMLEQHVIYYITWLHFKDIQEIASYQWYNSIYLNV